MENTKMTPEAYNRNRAFEIVRADMQNNGVTSEDIWFELNKLTDEEVADFLADYED